jgi:insecticidal toxin complex protein TccC
VRVLHWPQGEHDDQWRYSLSDHLGSSTLELDDEAGVLTREHYYPFGGTACWAGKSALVAKYKTIRYSGKERDATGLYYYGYRYYAPWLQRWINPDPSGSVDGLNVYRMVGNNSIKFVDEQGMVKGLSRFLSGIVSDSDAQSARKAHFKTHLLPLILARKEDDKDFAILRIKKMAKVDDNGAAEELLKGAVEVLSKARMTFNISPEKIHELKGKWLGNRWEQEFESGYDTEFRDGFEKGMFDYANSPSTVIKKYGSTEHVKFNGKMRPVYGALQLSDKLSSAGGAMSYGTAAFYLPEESRKYMTFLGGDSFDFKPSVNNLAASENMYPVFHRMESETWNVLSRVVAGQEAGLESPSAYIEWHSHNSVSWTGMTDLFFQSGQDLEKALGHEITSRFLKKNSIRVSSIKS